MADLPADDDGTTARADLQAGLTRLAGLVADSLDLPHVLAEVAASAVRAIPGADGAGVTLLRPQRQDDPVVAVAASAAFVAEIDAIQYETLREGPSITAALLRRTVRSGSLGGNKLWPRFGPRVGRLGVHSALAVPLLLADQVVGAISAYAHGKDAFDEHSAHVGELFAKPAAVAVHNAWILAEALALTSQLQAALATRPVIDQAIGIIRARTGRSEGDAFDQLRLVSQAEQRKLAEVAEQIVDDAVRRARLRRADQAANGRGV
ncbi:GAF and ANTAR domain-containing protein [Mycobacterium sp. BMJ-28]